MTKKHKHALRTSRSGNTANILKSTESPFWWTLEGWEDGERYKRTTVQTLDRWTLQSADTLNLHLHSAHSLVGDIVLHQQPNSDYLGGYIWTCGVVMTFLLQHPRWFIPNAVVLELGAGVAALPSIAWHRLGARYVLASDLPELVPQMQVNLRANQLECGNGRLEALALPWQEDLTAEGLKCLLDGDEEQRDRLWRILTDLDVITMNDVIYSEANVKALVDTLRVICSCNSKQLQILCMSELRNESAQEEFIRQASCYFHVGLLEPADWQPCIPHACRQDFIRLYQLNWNFD